MKHDGGITLIQTTQGINFHTAFIRSAKDAARLGRVTAERRQSNFSVGGCFISLPSDIYSEVERRVSSTGSDFLRCFVCWFLTAVSVNVVIAFPRSRRCVSHWAIKIQNQGWQRTDYNVEMRYVWLSGETGAKRTYSAVSLWLKYCSRYEKLILSGHFSLSTSHFLKRKKKKPLLTVTWESTEWKFLECFLPDRCCRGVDIWLVLMTRRFHSGLCVIWKQLVSELN